MDIIMSEDMKNENLEENNTEEVVEEVTENVESAVDLLEEALAKAENESEERPLSKMMATKTMKIVIPIMIVVVLLLAVGGVYMFRYNKYNHMGYVNVSGRTLEQVAQEANMTLDEFKEQYGLPEDMKADTTEAAAYHLIPMSKFAEMSGGTFEQVVEQLGLKDDTSITAETPWGEVLDKVQLKYYVGEAYLDQFKEYYGMGDEVTADTTWGEIRNIVDTKDMETRIEQEAAEKAAKEDAANTEGTENTESTTTEGTETGTDANTENAESTTDGTESAN